MIRKASVERATAETSISLTLALDGQGQAQVDTGVGFFDHMLTQLAFHGFFDLELSAKGDLHIDAHHTVEDVGICLGRAFAQCLEDRSGIARYGAAFAPMDEALAQVVLDFSSRPLCVINTDQLPGEAGDFSGQLAAEFMRALAGSAGLTLHVRLLYGENNHHILEAMFKALGRALDQATSREPRRGGVASSKGTL